MVHMRRVYLGSLTMLGFHFFIRMLSRDVFQLPCLSFNAMNLLLNNWRTILTAKKKSVSLPVGVIHVLLQLRSHHGMMSFSSVI